MAPIRRLLPAPTTQGNDSFLGHPLEDVAFQTTKAFFAELLEKGGDRATAGPDDLLIEIAKGPMYQPCHFLPQAGFASSHEANKEEG
jgi:hypothetical protein